MVDSRSGRRGGVDLAAEYLLDRVEGIGELPHLDDPVLAIEILNAMLTVAPAEPVPRCRRQTDTKSLFNGALRRLGLAFGR
jgi:hypothetical protein